MEFDFTRVLGQARAKNVLKKITLENNIPPFLMFIGPEGVGKATLALEFAKALNCENEEKRPCSNCNTCRLMSQFQHPDLYILTPNPEESIEKMRITGELRTDLYDPTKDIKINEVRELERELWKSGTYIARYRIVIVLNGENLNRESQNALLKTLEEPPPETIIIFVVSDLSRILETISSRARKIFFSYLEFKDFKNYPFTLTNKISLPLLFRLSNGSIGVAKRLLGSETIRKRKDIVEALLTADFKKLALVFEDLKSERKEMLNFVDFYLSLARDLLVIEVSDEKLINHDLKVELRKLRNKTTPEQIHHMFIQGAKSYRNIRRNANKEAVLYPLLLPFYPHSFRDIVKL
ncbi:MAG TPA: hypothetical protein ENL41_01395 [candidate division WOR-3 bacterium]|uniref:DNA polymerase III subunit delta n=1 Tax=candidate division WOR-3 bacterium TaxID=2052148 RepID=A0A7C5I4F2_UNCW3|nr:hypothetical protein [candidate division WOR-3 bacterium]